MPTPPCIGAKAVATACTELSESLCSVHRARVSRDMPNPACPVQRLSETSVSIPEPGSLRVGSLASTNVTVGKLNCRAVRDGDSQYSAHRILTYTGCRTADGRDAPFKGGAAGLRPHYPRQGCGSCSFRVRSLKSSGVNVIPNTVLADATEFLVIARI